jgi:hypothetical protein
LIPTIGSNPLGAYYQAAYNLGGITYTETSGTVTIAALAIAGTASITWPTGNGVVAVSAASPLAESAAGQLSCPGCATTTNGGALTATSPITISASGVIACYEPKPQLLLSTHAMSG